MVASRSATETATQGPATLVIVATATNALGNGKADLFVRGCPGCIDTTFGTAGVANVAPFGRALAVDAAGGVFVGGWDGKKAFVAHYAASGAQDTYAAINPGSIVT